jgi:hypothetical protein
MVAWLRRLRRRTQLSTHRPVYLPGEAVSVRAAMRGGGSEPAGAVLQLVRAVRVSWSDPRSTETLDPGTTDTGGAIVVVAIAGIVLAVRAAIVGVVRLGKRALGRLPEEDVEVVAKVPLPAGWGPGWTADLALPDPAVPTARGDGFAVAWSVRVCVPWRARPRVLASAPFAVLSPRSAHARLGGLPSTGAKAARQGFDCTLELEVAEREVEAGRALAGCLVVRARGRVAHTAIRVDLVRIASTGFASSGDGGREKTVASANLANGGTVEAGTSRAFPFALAVPPEATPSLRTVGLAVAWCVRATVGRRLRADNRAELPLTVYNAPDDPIPGEAPRTP